MAPTIVEFEQVVSAYRPKVFRFVLASLRDRDVAETVTQDCFLNAYKAWDSFRNDCSVNTWLMQIAVNLVRDHSRNRRLQFWRRLTQRARPVEVLQHAIANREPSPENQTLLNEQVQAAETLPERQRTVFLLRFVEDMDVLEIAAVTGMREGTIKSHLFLAIRAVRERIGATQ